jgi:hypothetical protein
MLQATRRNLFRFSDTGVDASWSVISTAAMKISGHETDSMFRRYGIVSDEDMTAALEKTAAYRSKMA